MVGTAMASFRRIQASKVTPKPVLTFSPAAAPGEYIRQGDVYFTLMESVEGLQPDPKPAAQLAPGETRGSRHVLNTLNGVEMFRKPNATVLDGPVIKVGDKSSVVVEHPDHGHVALPPGIYGVTYQRQFADDLRRARD